MLTRILAFRLLAAIALTSLLPSHAWGQVPPNAQVKTETAVFIKPGALTPLTTLPVGTIVTVMGESDGWAQIELRDRWGRRVGYVRSETLAPLQGVLTPASGPPEVRSATTDLGRQQNPRAVSTTGVPRQAEHVTPARVGNPVETAPISDSELPKISVQAARALVAPVIDGRLDDKAWSESIPASGFRQRSPKEGEPATEQTELRVVYDSSALYVGIRMFDKDPSRIIRRLARRDSDAETDSVTLYLDPSHDHLTGALFRVSAAGVLSDSIIYDDRRTDNTWDAVWKSEVTVDEQGWTAEMEIPFSQLRFPHREQHVWGINVSRYIPRKQERNWLELVPRQEARMASRMAHLTGMEGIRPSSHLELLPYTVGLVELTEPSQSGNPFNSATQFDGRIGLDLKWGLTSNLTLDATVNPDFGQVEVDPAVVNLTAFETSYAEKRPFFLEGTQIFRNFGRGGGAPAETPVDLVYSRRIGRSPEFSPSAQFVERPGYTSILGAAKLTGKTAGGWSVGLLDALTASEEANLANGSLRSSVEVEPLTNYFAARVSREGRRAGVGILTTAVNRALADDLLQMRLPEQAYVAAGDAYVFLDEARDWVLSGATATSWLTGPPAAIARQQTSSRRYFQRPDASHVELDPTADSLSGWSSEVGLSRNDGHVRVSTSGWAVSPGFEVNDLGFQRRADTVGAKSTVTFLGYEPNRFSRERWIALQKAWGWNFAGEAQEDAWSLSGALLFLNYWNLDGSLTLNRRVQDDRFTRGGPSMLSPGRRTATLGFSTDTSKAVSINATASAIQNEYDGWETSGGLYLNATPTPFIQLSAGPYLYRSRTIAQFVDVVTDELKVETYGRRYLFAEIGQTHVSMTTRVNVSLTPTLSLQVYAEPFLGVGTYGDLKELDRPRTFDFLAYGRDVGTIGYDAVSGEYLVDPDGAGPADSFTVANPDFNSKFLAVKAVLRWEWRPGSTLYLAWTQERFDESFPGNYDIGRDLRRLLSAPSNDVLMVKFSYWLGR